MKIYYGLAFIIICIGIAMTFFLITDTGNASSGPRYTWVSFSSFWNKNAIPSIKIKNPKKVDNGYLVNFGKNTKLYIVEQDKIILSACANYFSDNNEGGHIFIKVKNRLLDVGTFRWPQSNIVEIRDMFRNIGKADVNYYCMTSQFTLTHSEAAGWTICLDFVTPSNPN